MKRDPITERRHFVEWTPEIWGWAVQSIEGLRPRRNCRQYVLREFGGAVTPIDMCEGSVQEVLGHLQEWAGFAASRCGELVANPVIKYIRYFFGAVLSEGCLWTRPSFEYDYAGTLQKSSAPECTVHRGTKSTFVFSKATDEVWDRDLESRIYSATTPLEQQLAEGRAILLDDLSSFSTPGVAGATFYSQSERPEEKT